MRFWAGMATKFVGEDYNFVVVYNQMFVIRTGRLEGRFPSYPLS